MKTAVFLDTTFFSGLGKTHENSSTISPISTFATVLYKQVLAFIIIGWKTFKW